jgi:hypothetical protein
MFLNSPQEKLGNSGPEVGPIQRVTMKLANSRQGLSEPGLWPPKVRCTHPAAAPSWVVSVTTRSLMHDSSDGKREGRVLSCRRLS